MSMSYRSTKFPKNVLIPPAFNNTPLYSQYDKRWAGYPYNKNKNKICKGDTSTISNAGCGTMAVSMVINFWAKKGKCNPVRPQDVADFFATNGGIICNNGTDLSKVPKTLFRNRFGMNLITNATDSQIMTCLRKNYPCIISGNNYTGYNFRGEITSGRYNEGGHFLCLTGIDSNNRIRVNDSGNNPSNGLAITAFLEGKTPAQSRKVTQTAILYPVTMPSPLTKIEKKYTNRKRPMRQTRKKYSTRRQNIHIHIHKGGVSRRPTSSTQISSRSNTSRASRASRVNKTSRNVKSVLVLKNSIPVSKSHIQPSSRVGISKVDSEALQTARIISNFPRGMDKFLQMVINNYELLNYESVKSALRKKISINEGLAEGRLSPNGIIFISYISGRLLCLLKQLSTIKETEIEKKNELLHSIKKLEKLICLLDGVGCSWGIRPYNEYEMNIISEHYKNIKDEAGLQEYNRLLFEFIDKYFPILKKYTDPSHIVSSSMCRRLIPKNVMHVLPTLSEEVEEVD